MHISREPLEIHTVQAYSDRKIKLNNCIYTQSFILNRDTLITGWPPQDITDLNTSNLNPILELCPKIILIGHAAPQHPIPLKAIELIAQQQTGFECMSIGAACRTFNVLLSEQRDVVLGIILSGNTP